MIVASEVMLGLCLSPFHSCSASGCLVWVEGNVHSFSSRFFFSVPWYLCYKSELSNICRTGLIMSAELKFVYFTVFVREIHCEKFA
jgi:hypothetical protein